MSSAISRFTSALLAGSQENTLALAAVNFDFSLYKVEAPAEYQALGACLSKNRRNLAESGSQHVTARRLGALFRTEIPPAPALSALLKAYGSRVSDIAKHTATSQSEKPSIFTEYTGIDGTSIWAAATSGREELCMQLLACMLARFWTAPEAISIWCELIETRKQNLETSESQHDFQQIAALQANVSRENIADWDASARSWLRTADTVHLKQHTQLRLIMENIQVNVNTKAKTYESVLEAWISAITAADNLIKGVAQKTHTGAVLLGLSAWHLYPDLLTYSSEFQEVRQKDPLFGAGGLLTVGLEVAPGTEAGVRWSLPLAKLRYYGEPVVVTKYIDPHDDRVSYEDLMLIILGSLLANWQIAEAAQKETCQLLQQLLLSWINSRFPTARLFQDLNLACSSYLETISSKKSRTQRLVALGKRQCAQFMAGASPVLYSIIMQPEIYIYCIVDINDRIDYLRRTAERAAETTGRMKDENWIIEYSESGAEDVQICHYAYATAIARNYPNHAQRWTSGLPSNEKETAPSTQEPVHLLENWSTEHLYVSGNNSAQRRRRTPFDGCELHSLVFVRNEGARNEPSVQAKNAGTEEDDSFLKYFRPGSGTAKRIMFKPYLGLPGVATLYLQSHEPQPQKIAGKPSQLPKSSSEAHRPRINNVLEAFAKGSIDASRVLEVTQLRRGPYANAHPRLGSETVAKLLNSSSGNDLTFCEPLDALRIIAGIYGSLPEARISTRITKIGITHGQWYESRRLQYAWFSEPEHQREFRLNSFACIALLETGDIDLDPKTLTGLMGISTGDSIYLAAPLLCDPSEKVQPWAVNRVLGNVGRTGLSLLLPPAAPVVRPKSLDTWNLVSHDDYDGKAADSFATTSLHLSLTDYRVPYASTHGIRDIETFFQEAVVSVYDGRDWIGDVDVLKCLDEESRFHRINHQCPHMTETACGSFEQGGSLSMFRLDEVDEIAVEPNSSQASVLSTADNWYELIDRPNNALIARAHNNWIARLAIVVLAVHYGCTVYIVPQGSCEAACFSNPKFIKEFVNCENDVVVY